MSAFSAIRGTVIAGVLLSSLMLTACNGGTASVAADSQGTTPVASTGTGSSAAPVSTAQPLSLTGTASASVKVGEAFSFTPTLSGASGAVGYSIQNKPSWATFNVATGALTGAPSAANVGTYSNIAISATDAAGAKATLSAFSVTVAQASSSSGTATLSWTPPTQNTDGSAIANLAGYRIYYGASAGALTKSINVTNPGLTAYTVADLGSGTHYFGITAYTAGGVESGMSNIGSKTII